MIKASNCTRRKEGSTNCAFHKKEKEKEKTEKAVVELPISIYLYKDMS
jgi:hypothetical protein